MIVALQSRCADRGIAALGAAIELGLRTKHLTSEGTFPIRPYNVHAGELEPLRGYPGFQELFEKVPRRIVSDDADGRWRWMVRPCSSPPEMRQTPRTTQPAAQSPRIADFEPRLSDQHRAKPRATSFLAMVHATPAKRCRVLAIFGAFSEGSIFDVFSYQML